MTVSVSVPAAAHAAMDVKVEPGLGDSRGRGRGSSAHGGVKRQRPWEAAPGVPGNVEPRESAASGIVVGVRGRGGRNRGPSAAAAGDIGPNSSGQRGRAATKGKGKGKGRRNRSDSDAQPDDADTRVRDEAQAAVRKLVMAPLSTPLHVLESTDVAVLKVCAPCMYAAAWASTPAQHVRGTLPATSAEGGAVAIDGAHASCMALLSGKTARIRYRALMVVDYLFRRSVQFRSLMEPAYQVCQGVQPPCCHTARS